MKKISALLLTSALTLGLLAGCGNDASSSGSGASGSGSGDGAFVPEGTVTWVCTSSAGGGSDIGAFGRSALSAHLMDDGQIVKLRDGEFRFNKNQLFFLVLRSHESCCSCAAARKELVYSNIIGRIDSVRPPIRTFA